MFGTRSVRHIARDAAFRIVAAAHQVAFDKGILIAVAVVDAGGHIVIVDRMDGAATCAVDLCIDKARTSAATMSPTETWYRSTQPGGDDWGMNTALGGRFSAMPGGIPIIRDGEMIGAIGVSGGEAAEDVACATVGILAIGPS